MLDYLKHYPETLLFLLNILVAFLIYFYKDSLPPQVPLWFGRPRGASQLAPSFQLAIIPLASALFVGINWGIRKIRPERYLSQVLFGVSFVVSTLSTVAVFRIVQLVGLS